MGWTIMYGGVYAEMLGSLLCPLKIGEEYVFAAPMHEDSVVQLMSLENYGITLKWALENFEKSNSHVVDAGAIPVTWPDIVEAFVRVTGKQARTMFVSQEQWFEGATKKGMDPDAPLPMGSNPGDPATFLFRKTFGAWGGTCGRITREVMRLAGEMSLPQEDDQQPWKSG
ncbi:putative NAD(P)-binding domain superfamily [Septoria linicola]|nr:putative NAD(P)-binding domain superfamily [Septoria linicola]